MNKFKDPTINPTLAVWLSCMLVTGGVGLDLINKYYGKQDPVGYRIVIWDTAKMIVKVLGGRHEIACVHWVDQMSKTNPIDPRSEDKKTQIVRNIQPGETVTFSRTPDKQYTTITDAQWELIARIVNQNGNGTSSILSQSDLNTKVQECTAKV